MPKYLPDADGKPGEANSLQVVSLEHKMGSREGVGVRGGGVVYIGCMVGHNGVPAHNMPAGAQIAPSQTKIKVMP